MEIHKILGDLFKFFKSINRPDSWIIAIIGLVLGAIGSAAFQDYTAKHISLGNLPEYIMVSLAVLSVGIIVLYLMSIERANKSYRQFVDEKIDNFLSIKDKFDHFLGQLEARFKENNSSIKQEINKAFSHNFRCIFMQNRDERLKTMIEYIKKAEEHIYILSELSTPDDTERPAHKEYLNALNNVARDKDSENFKIVRIFVPAFNHNNADETSPDWAKLVTENSAYLEHFKILNNFGESSLLGYKDGPRGVSILLIDNQYLFLQFKTNYASSSLNKLLEGGFFFYDLSRSMTKRFKNSIDHMIAYSSPIRLIK